MIAPAPRLAQAVRSSSERSAPLPRILGTVGMLTSPFLLLSFVADGLTRENTTRLGAALGLVFAIGWLCSTVGLWRLRATGARWPARALLGVAVVGVILACLCNLQQTLDPRTDTLFFHITDVAWPLSMLLLIVIGVVAIVARVLPGWMRFVPLACGLWLPLGGVLGAVVGIALGQVLAGLHVTVGWFLLGYVVRAGQSAIARR